ncbi:TadE/TadG family type IV pilus assembly protein [Zhihengliuella halotolerans]|uniref:TadE/TadG family type IV pilus assembly protein n=1 Tax=Zhihengliuella halotolerans TaxID=370736 RepID=UPI000C802204|nr:TadE/TadG family type IV pilus assembly protein [Zhihengliuella halotolerans]
MCRSRTKTNIRQEHGGSAVEFALIIPLLLGLIFGILEYAWYFNQQISATQGARAAARAYVLHHNDPGFDLVAVADAGAPTVDITSATASQAGCPEGVTISVVIAGPNAPLLGLFPLPAQIKAKGAMQCEA